MDFEGYKRRFKIIGVKYIRHSLSYNLLYFGTWFLLSVIISYTIIIKMPFTYNPDAYLWTMSTIFQGLSAFLGLFWAGLFFGRRNLYTNIEESAKELYTLLHPGKEIKQISDDVLFDMLKRLRLKLFHLTPPVETRVKSRERELRELIRQKSATSYFPNIPSVHAVLVIFLSIILLSFDPFLGETIKIQFMLIMSFLAVYVFGLLLFSVLAIYHDWSRLVVQDETVFL